MADCGRARALDPSYFRAYMRMAELLRIVKEEHDKDRGTRDSIQRSMLL
jgi:hypothetical protein